MENLLPLLLAQENADTTNWGFWGMLLAVVVVLTIIFVIVLLIVIALLLAVVCFLPELN